MEKLIKQHLFRLREDWARILKKAWSVRLMLLAALLSGVEVALPFFTDRFPQGIAGILSLLVTMAALIARVVVQQDVTPEKESDDASAI